MPAIKHGTVGGYTNRKCRCDACRLAFNAVMLALRRRRRDAGQCVDCKTPSHGFARCTRCRERTYARWLERGAEKSETNKER